ncbi:MAG: site-specific integrase, partial [Cetobacterium sp.]
MNGSVRQRGKKWYWSMEIESAAGSRKRIERVGGLTKKEAQTALRKAIHEYENGGKFYEPSDKTVSELLDYWVEHYVSINTRANTQRSYLNTINNHIKPFLGDRKIKNLTPAIIQDYYNTIYRNGCTRTSLDYINNVLACSLRYAVFPCQFIKENPQQYVVLPKFEKIKKDNRTITSKDFQEILAFFSKKKIRKQFELPFYIGYYTGLRIGEVLALRWEDIDFKNKTISVSNNVVHLKEFYGLMPPKTSTSNRVIRIGEFLLEFLKSARELQCNNKKLYNEYYHNYFLDSRNS